MNSVKMDTNGPSLSGPLVSFHILNAYVRLEVLWVSEIACYHLRWKCSVWGSVVVSIGRRSGAELLIGNAIPS